MKRFSAWLIGPLMLTTSAVAAVPAGASTARPAVAPATVAANYTAYGKWGKDKTYTSFSLTLYSNHTGTDHFGDTIVWSLTLKSLVMTFDGGLWTYHGTKTKAGFNSLAHPGTLSNINGGTGIWYAIKVP